MERPRGLFVCVWLWWVNAVVTGQQSVSGVLLHDLDGLSQGT